MSKRKRGRNRSPLGRLTAEELLVHRELEFLRVAGRREDRRTVIRRWNKLQQARAAVVQRNGQAARTQEETGAA